MGSNVFVHPEYGQFTVKLQVQASHLDYSPNLEVIQINLRKIKKAKIFVFYPSKSGSPDRPYEGKVFNIHGIEYNKLKGVIKPVYGIHSNLLGYESSYNAVRKNTALNLKDAYNLGDKGLTRSAMKLLDQELSPGLEAVVAENKDRLTNELLAAYLDQLLTEATLNLNTSKDQVRQAQKIYTQRKEAFSQVLKVIEVAHPNTKVSKSSP